MLIKQIFKISCRFTHVSLSALFLIFSLQTYAQNEVVTGKVTDEGGKPVAGASVTVKNSTSGTATDENGAFQISTSLKNALIISAVGYSTIEAPLDGKTSLNIVLKSFGNTLEDVVIVGYGTKIKRDIGGAVLSVDQKLLKDRPVTNTLSALQGAAPGLVITRTNGQPGREGISANIRGITSLGAGNSPLVIIDGVEGDINALNPNDIQSVSVLEDAASASIYGAKAGGGVILVTTKSGKTNQKTQVDLTPCTHSEHLMRDRI